MIARRNRYNVRCPRQDFALLERQVLEATSQRRQDLDMAGSPAADPLRHSHVNLAMFPIDVLPLLIQDFLSSKSSESSECEIRRQAPFTVRGFETSRIFRA